MTTYFVKTGGNDTTGDGLAWGTAWATPGKAGGSLSADDILYIGNGTYTLTNSTANTAGGPLALPTNGACNVVGCADGDETDFSSFPTIDAGSQNNVSLFALDGADGHNQIIFNIKFDGQQGSNNFGINGTNQSFEFAVLCEAVDCPTGFDTLVAISCKSSYASASGKGFHDSICFHCWADTHAAGFDGSARQFVNCIASNCTAGWDDSAAYRCAYSHCIAYNSTNSGFACRNTTTLSGGVFTDCVAYGNGAFGWDFNTLSGSSLINCAAGNNTSGRTDGNEALDLDAITLTADPFTNAASGDFSPNNTAGGGALLKAAALGVFGQAVNNFDVGAVQHSDPAGGGGAAYIIGG